MQNLDCANCAAKMENEINKINTVKDVKVNFMTQKLTLNISDENADDTIQKIIFICKKIEPDCIIEI